MRASWAIPNHGSVEDDPRNDEEGAAERARGLLRVEGEEEDQDGDDHAHQQLDDEERRPPRALQDTTSVPRKSEVADAEREVEQDQRPRRVSGPGRSSHSGWRRGSSHVLVHPPRRRWRAEADGRRGKQRQDGRVPERVEAFGRDDEEASRGRTGAAWRSDADDDEGGSARSAERKLDPPAQALEERPG